jgi:hypothetical protein
MEISLLEGVNDISEENGNWFSDFIKFSQFLDFFSSKDNSNNNELSKLPITQNMLKFVITSSWKEVKKESIRKRIFLVRNIPTAPKELFTQLSLFLFVCYYFRSGR